MINQVGLSDWARFDQKGNEAVNPIFPYRSFQQGWYLRSPKLCPCSETYKDLLSIAKKTPFFFSGCVSNQPTIFSCPILTSGELLQLDTFQAWTLNFDMLLDVGRRFFHVWCYILNCNSFLWSMLPQKLDLTLKLPSLLIDNPHWKAVHGQPAGHPSWKPPFQNICSWSSKQYFHDVFIQHEIMAVIYSCFFLFFFSLRSLGGQNKRLGSWSWWENIHFQSPFSSLFETNQSNDNSKTISFTLSLTEMIFKDIGEWLLRWVILSQANGQTAASISGTRWFEKCRACLCRTCEYSTQNNCWKLCIVTHTSALFRTWRPT